MYVKNLLNAGTYFIPVPVGLPLTVQYGASGRLQKVYYGHILEQAVDLSKELLSSFISTDIVPTEIPMKNGTTWIRGLLHTETVYPIDGVLPTDIKDIMLADYADNPGNFKFYAATMDSVGAAFKNPMSNMQWLHTAKFSTLRGWVVPQDLNKTTYETLLRTAKYPFRHNYTCEYIIYEGEHYEYVMLNPTQYVVSDIEKFLNPNGWLKANIYCKNEDKNNTKVYCADYSEITYFRIKKSSIVVLHNGNIVDCISKDNTMPDRVVVCPVCGKQYVSAVSGITQCDDPHCMSTQYNNLVQMLTVFNLPIISWDDYSSLVYDKKLLTITDIFDLPEYADVNISTKLSAIFAAIVPLTDVPDVKLFDLFCNKCNNHLKTVKYYMDNPERILTDLGLASPVSPRFIEWLSDPHNLVLFDTIIGLPQVTITLKSKKFDGLPILRDKIIYLTGDFKRGMYRDIVSLLESFSATVVTDFTDKVNCVVIGDMHQNIDGRIVRKARENKIPVFEESQLFKMYSLDEDIKENLGEE